MTVTQHVDLPRPLGQGLSRRWSLLASAGLALLFASSIALPRPVAAADAGAPTPPNAQRLEEWRAMRFGMFVHWGPVSLKGTEIGWSRGAQIPVEEYDQLYTRFNPVKFNADAWATAAREAGMKYLVFTTKHHDGFCMWDTRQTDHNIMRSPFGRDVVKELAAACRRQGIAFGTYHSTCDWHHPDFPLTSPGGSVRRTTSDLDRYEAYLHAQVKELITGYGPLLLMWFDVPQEFDQARGLKLEQWTRSLQPDIIINNRSGAQGDYDTPEQRVGGYQDQRPWETCMTIANQWAWKPDDPMKSLAECLQTLVRCAGGDGNLLFNVGPTPEGLIEPAQVARLKEMGAWLAKHGESVYGTRGGPWKPTKDWASTRKGKTVYLHVFRWVGDTVSLPNLPGRLMSSSLMDGGMPHVAQTGDRILVTVLPWDRREIDTVVKLEFAEPVMAMAAVASAPATAVKATASNVYQGMDEFAADRAWDGDSGTRWATDGGTHQAWLAADLGKPARFDGLRVEEAYAGRVQRFEFQLKEAGTWKTVLTSTNLGEHFAQKFPAVSAQEVRLNIQEATEGPTLNEIQLDRLTDTAEAPAVAAPDPARADLQREFLRWGFGMFLHFNLATFADVDWATGHEDPVIFRPAKLDCGQWADAAKAAGMKYAVLTTKHTEGYALWDSETTKHDITACKNYRGGKGDVVREFVEAFRKRGLKVGFYYCFPGDYSQGRLKPGQTDLHGLPPEAAGDFVGLMRRQLTELLTKYGPVDLLWIDQYANPYTKAAWPEFLKLVKSLQPRCLVLANNSHDFAETDIQSYEFPWMPTLPPADNTMASEVCDTIQPGARWFWDQRVGKDQLQPADDIARIVQMLNARQANYLLNVPPDRDGLIPAAQVERLREVGRLLRNATPSTTPGKP
jgi:alpha-L-fucosidase